MRGVSIFEPQPGGLTPDTPQNNQELSGGRWEGQKIQKRTSGISDDMNKSTDMVGI